jgi:hypothetical protein
LDSLQFYDLQSLLNMENVAQNPSLTSSQMDTLQRLVKNFKELSKRFAESHLAKVAETFSSTQQTIPSSIPASSTGQVSRNGTNLSQFNDRI